MTIYLDRTCNNFSEPLLVSRKGDCKIAITSHKIFRRSQGAVDFILSLIFFIFDKGLTSFYLKIEYTHISITFKTDHFLKSWYTSLNLTLKMKTQNGIITNNLSPPDILLRIIL